MTGGQALFWPRQHALLVADLHLEKGSFFARAGQMLPPYDSRETLTRLAQAVRATGARRVIALGDNFHDDEGIARLEPHARGMLDALVRALDWIWITGNHDAGLGGDGDSKAGGTCEAELRIGGIALRHKAAPGTGEAEISGHFHPRFALRTRGRRVERPCAIVAERDGGTARMILPAFGALTGGMRAGDPQIVAAMQPADRIDVLVPLRERMATFALWRAAA